MQLERPTKQLVERYVLKFKKRFASPENAIQLLCEKFPDNESFESVLLKSIVINTLYATRIIDIRSVAEHIAPLNIDEDIRNGVPEIVDTIAKMTIKGKPRNNYSFATKYCSFHNPTAYPIYDNFVDCLLWEYRKQDHFARFYRKDLKSYKKFKQVLDEFRSFYGLEDVSLKALDNFLWGYGQEKFPSKVKSLKSIL